MAAQNVLCEVKDRILTLTLNRPDRLNAFNREMLAEMLEALDRADADDEVRAVIVTGQGRGFCAGADLSAGPGAFDADERARVGIEDKRDGGGLLTLRIFDCKKPVIAAINGPAVGVGITMTLPMDIRIAADGARFGFVFARRGIVPEACSTWFLPRVVGISKACEWIFSGRVYPIQEGLEAGLVRSLHAPGDLLPAAREIAAEIATQTSAVSVALARQMLWKMLAADHPMEAHRIDSRGVRAMGASADAREGVASFLEKRPPQFSMRPSQDMPSFYPWWQPRKYD